jgi:hypothetical protein
MAADKHLGLSTPPAAFAASSRVASGIETREK